MRCPQNNQVRKLMCRRSLGVLHFPRLLFQNFYPILASDKGTDGILKCGPLEKILLRGFNPPGGDIHPRKSSAPVAWATCPEGACDPFPERRRLSRNRSRTFPSEGQN